MKGEKENYKKGFTLLEILLVLGILGVIAVFTIGIAHSIRNLTKVNDTKSRMEQITAKAKEYYRGHEQLPAPGTTPADSVPVGVSDLNMEQKFRLDSWGQYFFYRRVVNDSNDGRAGDINIDSYTGAELVQLSQDTETLITGLEVNNKEVAGVIISYGPNQTPDFSATAAYPAVYTLDPGSDDIIVPIDVSQEAVEITLEELKVLQDKVNAFDAVYQGVDNNGDGPVDEDTCVRQDPITACPPNGSTNDPNCGMATLDDIKANVYASTCSTTCNGNSCPWGDVTTSDPHTLNDEARAFIFCFYCLADKAIVDPWLDGYVWGNPGLISDGASDNDGKSDPRYHKFFSYGPDGLTNSDHTHQDSQDDIIP